MNSKVISTFVFLFLITAAAAFAAAPIGTRPASPDGRPLNLDFEDGTLKDWVAEGKAFDKQPIKGDTVHQRRQDMKSEHTGDYWIGTFEIAGDDATGTLTSVPFKVTQPFASFLVGGGSTELTRVELVRADTQKVFFKVSGFDSENLRPVVIDLQPHLGKEFFIRIVDRQIGAWGHINFDDFKFYSAKPVFANAIDPVVIAKQSEAPPVDVVKFAGLSPEDAAKEATVPPGFKLHLFAGEPDVKQPIAFALDDRGRVWVAEAYTYPRRAAEGQGKDRILVFEDTNGDHKFDKRTVFMEGLNLVSGLEVGFGGVWVGAAPNLKFIPVKDWDDPKPAGEPQILLDGWDFKADTHETLNTFTWGPDGWLYGCHGVFCPSFVGKPGTPAEQRQRVDAAVWRYHPTKQLFEVFAEGTSNPWGIDFDEYGQCIIEACVIPHLWHMIQGARYERQGGQHYNINPDEQRDHDRYHAAGTPKHVNPFIYDDIKTIGDHVHYAGSKGPHAANGRSDAAGGGHAHAGLMAYLGGSWPEEYRNKVFMNNIHGQRLNMDILERQGSGYVGHHGPDFVNFNDAWSQVLNLLYDQNGSVYFIDWYDKNQCHHNNVDGHDRTNGRIFKLVYNDEKWTPVDLRKKSDEELVNLQLHPNDWYARHARRILQERNNRMLASGGIRHHAHSPLGNSASSWVKWEGSICKTDDPLIKILRENQNVTIKLRALWTLYATGYLGDPNSDPAEPLIVELLRSRDEYLRAWTIQLVVERGDAVWGGLLTQINRLAKEDPSPVVRRYLASAAQRIEATNRWDLVAALNAHAEDATDHNLPLMAWFAMEPLVSTDMNRALSLAIDSKLPRILNFTTRRVAAIGSPEALAAITQTLSRAAEDTQRLDILSGLSVALKGQRSVTMPAGWESIESTLSASANSDVRALTQSLSLTFGSGKALAALRKTVTDSAADPSARRTALDSLLDAKDAGLPSILQALLQEPALRGAALRGLAGYDDSNTPAAILAIYSSLSATEKREALNTLSSRSAYARPLLEAISSG
ncbi:MAG: PVC-type heme-binding CxxCH protein, partial [Verrucomicrobiota bacterium]